MYKGLLRNGKVIGMKLGTAQEEDHHITRVETANMVHVGRIQEVSVKEATGYRR